MLSRGPRTSALIIVLLVATLTVSLQGWGAQGHRLVGLVAANHLTPIARRNVAWLLGAQSLADVSSWADGIRPDIVQTGAWHFVNIIPEAKAYDRDRDCPLQPGVMRGTAGDVWRDCVVDRLRYNEERLANLKLDRADRAIALKFIVHFVGDIHQPFHASAIERGGNGILVRLFGSENCGDPARPFPCNLHSVWDTQLIAHRGLEDRAYTAILEKQVRERRLTTRPTAEPAEWAMESLMLSNAAMVAQRADIDDAYYQKNIAVIDERLALGGVRLAALINRSLKAAPPAR
jgi:hypothetical protein